MIALIVVGLGAVIAAVGTGVLAARSSRRPRVYFVAWAVALFGFAIGLGATTLGYLAGYDSLIFRAMELGTQLIAPLALCLALVEIAGRSLAARFGMRLAVSGIAIIAVVILGTDPINPNVTFSAKWPDPAIYYQIAPLTVLGFLTLFTAVTAVVSLAIMLVRSSRGLVPRDEGRPGVLLALGALAAALPGLAWLVHKSAAIALPLPAKDIFAASCTLAAGLVWYAARIAGSRDLGQAPFGAPVSSPDDDAWDETGRPIRPQTTREFDEFSSAQRLGGNHSYEDGQSDLRYPGLAALLDGDAEVEHPGNGGRHHRDDDPHGQLFGQIAIYTLNEGRTADFDRLTEWVVAQVQAKEPDTLVYIVHAVPTAPMQRILYEVYRDRAAHDEHLRRGYVRTYEAEQRPLVLTTNVIELGLQQAKVSPLPSMSAISDILSESGIDLTGVTRSSQSGGQPRSQGYHRSSSSGSAQHFEPHFEPDFEPDFEQDVGQDFGRDLGRRDGPDDLGRARSASDEFAQPEFAQPEYDQPEYDQPEYDQPEYDQPYSGWADIRGEDSRYR